MVPFILSPAPGKPTGHEHADVFILQPGGGKALLKREFSHLIKNFTKFCFALYFVVVFHRDKAEVGN